jgi:putative hydrolase of the HAD superfamily
MLKAILFDLDNTLYSESCGIFDRIDQRMNEWLIAKLNVPPLEVNEFRNHYFQKYGTTLRGLMLHHDVDPRDFLDYVHDVPVHEFISADEELRNTLDQVRARKMIFTNSDMKHANRILDALTVLDQFEKIFDIEAMGFIPKPNPEPYLAALNYLQLPPKEVLLIDDMERNLKPAREIGMSTVLIGNGTLVDDGHHAIENIKQLANVLAELSRQGI